MLSMVKLIDPNVVPVYELEIVYVHEIQYRKDDIIVISDKLPKVTPLFAQIRLLVMDNTEKIFLFAEVFKTVRFSKQLRSFCVERTTDYRLIIPETLLFRRVLNLGIKMDILVISGPRKCPIQIPIGSSIAEARNCFYIKKKFEEYVEVAETTELHDEDKIEIIQPQILPSISSSIMSDTQSNCYAITDISNQYQQYGSCHPNSNQDGLNQSELAFQSPEAQQYDFHHLYSSNPMVNCLALSIPHNDLTGNTKEQRNLVASDVSSEMFGDDYSSNYVTEKKVPLSAPPPSFSDDVINYLTDRQAVDPKDAMFRAFIHEAHQHYSTLYKDKGYRNQNSYKNIGITLITLYPKLATTSYSTPWRLVSLVTHALSIRWRNKSADEKLAFNGQRRQRNKRKINNDKLENDDPDELSVTLHAPLPVTPTHVSSSASPTLATSARCTRQMDLNSPLLYLLTTPMRTIDGKVEETAPDPQHLTPYAKFVGEDIHILFEGHLLYRVTKLFGLHYVLVLIIAIHYVFDRQYP
ncbi:unnamed protein product, partial [Didymodactylos carnosus]